MSAMITAVSIFWGVKSAEALKIDRHVERLRHPEVTNIAFYSIDVLVSSPVRSVRANTAMIRSKSVQHGTLESRDRGDCCCLGALYRKKKKNLVASHLLSVLSLFSSCGKNDEHFYLTAHS